MGMTTDQNQPPGAKNLGLASRLRPPPVKPAGVVCDGDRVIFCSVRR